MSSWYLIHTKMRQEQVALQNLERQGFECFLPLISAEKIRQGALETVQEPLFPRYLFIRLSTGIEAQSWSPIRSTLGVSCLVSFGQTPAKVEDQLVAQLRARTQNQQAPVAYFSPGESVLLTDGPFAGIEAAYQMTDGEGRVMVLFNMMTKTVKMTVSPAGLRKVK